MKILKRHFLLDSIILAVFFVTCFILSKSLSLEIPTYHLDGAFQTANGLFRLDRGYSPGFDFFPYIGMGPIYFLYPIFKITGSNLASSLIAAKGLVFFSAALSLSVIYHFVFQRKELTSSCLVGFSLYSILLLLVNHFHFKIIYPLDVSMVPGNSLRPIRFFIVYLVLISYLAVKTSKIKSTRKLFFSAAIFAIAFNWSNDYAYTTGMLFYLLYVFDLYQSNDISIKKAFSIAGVFFLAWIFSINILTHFHPLGLLYYNFHDVLADQWWYFAPYSQTSRVFNYQQLFFKVLATQYLSIIVLSLLFFKYIFSRKESEKYLLWLGFALFVGALIPTYSGALGEYFLGFDFWAFFVTLLYLVRLCNFLVFEKMLLNFSDSKNCFRYISYLLIVTFCIFSIVDCKNNIRGYRKDTNYFYVSELGGYLPKNWSDYIDFIRRDNSSLVLEEYWGIYGAIKKNFSPWRVDMIIHALGDKRLESRSKLVQMDAVITTNYLLSPTWQPWIFSQNMWFYEVLLANFLPIYESPSTIVWKKGNVNNKGVASLCWQDAKGKLFINSQIDGLYKIHIKYRYNHRGKSFLLIRNNIWSDGYVSIKPKATEADFPIYIFHDGISDIPYKILSDDENYSFNIYSCNATLLSNVPKSLFDPLNVVWPAEPVSNFVYTTSNNFTDENWLHGFSRTEPKFFIDETPENKKFFRPGTELKFSDDKSVVIRNIHLENNHIVVTYSGNQISGDKVGFPHKILKAH